MTLSFFSGRKRAAQASPHVDPACVGVNVMATRRDDPVDGIPWESPDAETVMHIHKHKPTSGTSVPNSGRNLKLARAAAVLDRHADYLEGKGPAPELHEVIAALRLSAEAVRDSIVIGGAK